MSGWAKDFHFTVDPEPKKEVFAPKGGWGDTVAPWATAAVAAKQVDTEYQNDEVLKKKYGVELAKSNNSFEAAKIVLGENDRAVWASFNWMTDPVVLGARDAYLKTLEESVPPLDREQLAAKVLKLADGEKVRIDGIERSTIEAKDRIAAFKLYSEILGYTGKVEIDASTKNFTTNNELKVILVKAEQPKPIINQAPNVKSEIPNALPSPINLKLVKAG